ncbi:MAG: heme exporter protein CcmB [Chloroflexi bacterium]|nr:heme exporter protein CcmB [Chloroflexota bacterium]
MTTNQKTEGRKQKADSQESAFRLLPSTAKPSFIKATLAIVQKDLAAELRSRELLSAMLVFSMLVILIFNFALELDVKVRQSVTAGVLWTTFAFAGTLGLNRSMAV